MKPWLILIIFSPIAYILVQRSVKNITKTPVWLCWLVMMLPAFIWTTWVYVFGQEQPIPLPVFLFPLIICPLLYGWLVQRGKPQATTKTETEKQENMAMATPAEESSPLRPINLQEETTLRNCFPWDVYYLQNIDYRPQAIFCRGKLKTIPEKAYEEIKNNIEAAFGDRFFLIFQESFRGKPFFALVPNPQATKDDTQLESPSDTRWGLALGLFLATLLTTTIAGVNLQGISLEELNSNPDLLLTGLAYSLPLLLILGVHEFSHYLVAIYYKIRTTLPYFIPFPFLLNTFYLGTLGAFVQKRSPVPHRKALFDIAIVGPVAGFLVTLPVLFWGLTLSSTVSLEDTNTASFDALDPRISLLLSLLSKLALGEQFKAGMAIDFHPLAAAGCVGLLITAINLMPIGGLDGGNIIHAVFGQRMAIAVGQITRILAILFALIHPHFWIWAIIMWLIPLIDRPALNDVTELNHWRDLGGLLSLALLVLIILPLPASIANWLHI